MHFISCKLFYAQTIVAKWMDRLSTVMEGASSNPVTVPCVFFPVFFRFYNFINLFLHRYNSLSFPIYFG